jgi:hypothetical protein
MIRACDLCDKVYDAIKCHWRCPECGLKESCCEGAPLNAPRNLGSWTEDNWYKGSQ